MTDQSKDKTYYYMSTSYLKSTSYSMSNLFVLALY